MAAICCLRQRPKNGRIMPNEPVKIEIENEHLDPYAG